MIGPEELTAFLEELHNYKVEYRPSQSAAEKKSLIDDIRKAVTDLHRETDRLKTQVKETAARRDEVKKQNDDMKRQIAIATNSLKESEESIARLNAEAQTMQDMIDEELLRFNTQKMAELAELKTMTQKLIGRNMVLIEGKGNYS
uniref:Chromosome partition protein Smc n=1 Tax=Steinernema glaseri TaxID=37863 RepID=A0A1I8APQ6_9BILA